MDTDDLQKKGSKASEIAAEEAAKAAEKAKGLGAKAFSFESITTNPVPVAVIGALLGFVFWKDGLITAAFAAAIAAGVAFAVVFLTDFLPRLKAEVLTAPAEPTVTKPEPAAPTDGFTPKVVNGDRGRGPGGGGIKN